MDEISLEQLGEMQKELFKKQCDLDIQKAFVKHFIKKKQDEQLTIPVVVKSFICDTCKDKGIVSYWHKTGVGIKPCKCRETN